MYSIGELIGALFAGYVKHILSYRLCFLLGTLLCPLGYAVYSSAVVGWMVVLARLIIGMNCGLILSLIIIYIGETIHYDVSVFILPKLLPLSNVVS